jgi:hypothetical protein
MKEKGSKSKSWIAIVLVTPTIIIGGY